MIPTSTSNIKRALEEYADLINDYQRIAASMESVDPESNPMTGVDKLKTCIDDLDKQWIKLASDVAKSSSYCVFLSGIGLSNLKRVLNEIVEHAFSPVIQSGPQYSGPDQITAWRIFKDANLTDVVFCSDPNPTIIDLQKKYVMDTIQKFSNLVHGDNVIKRSDNAKREIVNYIKKVINHRKLIVESARLSAITFKDITNVCTSYYEAIVNLADGSPAQYNEYVFQAIVEPDVYDAFVSFANLMARMTPTTMQTQKDVVHERINKFLESFDKIHLVGENRTFSPGDTWKTEMRQIIPMYLSCIPYKRYHDDQAALNFANTTRQWVTEIGKHFTKGSTARANDLNQMQAALRVISTGKPPDLSHQDDVKSGFEKLLKLVQNQLNASGMYSMDNKINDAINRFKNTINTPPI